MKLEDVSGRPRIPLRMLRGPSRLLVRSRWEVLRGRLVDLLTEARGCAAVLVLVAIIGLGVVKLFELFGVAP